VISLITTVPVPFRRMKVSGFDPFKENITALHLKYPSATTNNPPAADVPV
jgi:hypothetical protein